MLFAGRAQRPLWDADRCTDFGKVEWPIGIFLQESYEPCKDDVVAATSYGRLDGPAFGETPYDYMS
jgi:hypothetical protein